MNAGGIPVVLPVHDNIEVIREQISHLDGLLLSGGVDSDPALYGEDSLQEIGVISPERDKFEIMLLEEYLKTGKPILAICRGLQLVNIYFGGTLYQDIKIFGYSDSAQTEMAPLFTYPQYRYSWKR